MRKSVSKGLMIVLCFMMMPFQYLYAESQVILEKDGIIVAQEVIEGRVLPIMTGKVTMNADVALIISWLSAVHTYIDWQYNCKEARLIEGSDNEMLTYNRVGSPWPVSDRDVVLRSTQTLLDDGVVHLEFRSLKADELESMDLKVPRGVVRMGHLFGSYRLTPLSDGQTRIVYTLDSDPGGSLPAWLVKRASKDLPYKTLSALRQKVESGKPSEV